MGHPPATQMKNYRQLKAMRKEELAFSRDEHPKELLIPNGIIDKQTITTKPYMWQKMNSPGCNLYMPMDMYIYIC